MAILLITHGVYDWAHPNNLVVSRFFSCLNFLGL
jgi:hypothetical protein